MFHCFHLMITSLWICHLSLMSLKHPAHPKIYSQAPFRRVTGYLIPTLGFVTCILTLPATLFNGTIILLFHWGNFQTDVGLPEKNVENQGTGANFLTTASRN